MLGLRNLVRSAPRCATRFTPTAFTKITRPSTATSSLLSTTCRQSAPRLSAGFHTSRHCRATAGETDAELIAKLESELQMEVEMREEDNVPASIKDYLENGPFEIEDVPGREEVKLTRKFGDETISVSFSITDLNNIDPDSEMGDRALGDEEDIDDMDGNKSGKEQNELEDDSAGDESDESAYPAHVNVIIEKAGKGAMVLETTAQDGMIVIDNVFYYKDAKVAHAKTADQDHQRQELYVGPPFGNLDEDLQVLLERYLDERGINTALALFVPDYIDLKEQKEYVRWLENVKGFVEA